MQVSNKFAEHVNMLIGAINEVKPNAEAETYDIDPGDTLVAPLLFPPLKLGLKAEALNSSTKEYDDVIKEMGMLALDFSKLALADVYAIQHAATTKIHIRENNLAYKATKKTRKRKECKALLRKKEQEIEAHE